LTSLRVSIFAALAATALILVVFELVRSRRVQERYALIWLTAGVLILVLAVWRDGLNHISKLLGIAYPPNTLLVVGSFSLILLLLHFSTVISRLSEQNKTLAQRLALLEGELGAAPQPKPTPTGSSARRSRSASLSSTKSLRSPRTLRKNAPKTV
jgi:hypothetical protein